MKTFIYLLFLPALVLTEDCFAEDNPIRTTSELLTNGNSVGLIVSLTNVSTNRVFLKIPVKMLETVKLTKRLGKETQTVGVNYDKFKRRFADKDSVWKNTLSLRFYGHDYLVLGEQKIGTLPIRESDWPSEIDIEVFAMIFDSTEKKHKPTQLPATKLKLK